MDDSPRLSCTFASALHGANGVEAIDTSSLRSHHMLKTRRLPVGVWQSGLLKYAIAGRFETFVFLGDASHLSTWVAAAILRLRRKRVLFWTIGWHVPEFGLKRLVRLAFYRLANVLLLYGNLAKELGIELGYPEPRMTVIHNSQSSGAPLRRVERLAPVDFDLLKSDNPIVGAVIRLNPVKRLELLILAAGELRQRGRPVTVVLAGSGPAAEDLVALAAVEGVDLRLLGPVYTEADLEVIYGEITVSVVPSAVGLTAIQSMAHGIPVISDDSPYSQMPEWEAIRPGITGDVFESGNHVSLADCIDRWVVRQAVGRQSTHNACVAEVAERWNSNSQLPLIEKAILGKNA